VDLHLHRVHFLVYIGFSAAVRAHRSAYGRNAGNPIVVARSNYSRTVNRSPRSNYRPPGDPAMRRAKGQRRRLSLGKRNTNTTLQKRSPGQELIMVFSAGGPESEVTPLIADES